MLVIDFSVLNTWCAVFAIVGHQMIRQLYELFDSILV